MVLIFAILAMFLPACTTDGLEATMCYWDATQAGNGQGTSFLALSEGITIYLPTTNGR